MGKVKITQEQAETIERLLVDSKPHHLVRHHIKHGWNNELNGNMRSLSNDELIRSLYIGYEVEPEFSVGNHAYHKPSGRIAKIAKIDIKDGLLFVNDEDFTYFHKNNARLATPSEIAEEKERRFFKRHGREPWELRKGDMLFEEESGNAIVVEEVSSREDMTSVIFPDDDYMYLCDVKEYYKVAVFAKNRLDGDSNE